ncbi:LD-carboxypeptidase [Bdellovibrionota bacterium FG-1]
MKPWFPRIGIVAPSSKVPEIEFSLGVDKIRAAGFEVQVHPQVFEGHLFFAGTDAQRAEAFFEYAILSSVDVLWAARGGYGAIRLLPLLEKMTQKRGIPPKKLLVGFSDSTALLEFVRTRWKWSTLHASMPGLRKFCALPPHEWQTLLQWIRRKSVAHPFGRGTRLEFLGSAPRQAISGVVVGGNLTVWTSLIGTPYAGNARGKIVFFEDVDENLYRIDRMVQQLIHSGALKGARAVVLGNFMGCRDTVPSVLVRRPAAQDLERMIHSPQESELGPLRPSLEPSRGIEAIFSEITKAYGIPIARGLPVGHGPEKVPLPLGATFKLSPRGALALMKWDWLQMKKM